MHSPEFLLLFDMLETRAGDEYPYICNSAFGMPSVRDARRQGAVALEAVKRAAGRAHLIEVRPGHRGHSLLIPLG
jgi:hypothetical protein